MEVNIKSLKKKKEIKSTKFITVSSICSQFSQSLVNNSNWMNTDLKHWSRFDNKSFHTVLIGDSLIAGLTCYSKVWNRFFKPLNAFNYEIGGNRVKNVLWQTMWASAWFMPFFFFEKCCYIMWYQQLKPWFTRGYCEWSY